MRFPRMAALLVAGLAAPVTVEAQTSPFEFEIEAGPLWQSKNDVEVPNDGTASRFSLDEALAGGPFWVGRVYLTWHRSESQSLRLLYAPLTVSGEGTVSGVVDFAGERFQPGVPFQGRYRFNSYRATYRWRVAGAEKGSFWLGFTAKIRDAAIELEQGTTNRRSDDLGFVPLLHVAAERSFGPVSALVDVDALAGGPGRAIDASIEVEYEVDDRFALQAGYRTVEGGADVDTVYNFAWLNYGAVSVVWRP